MSILEIIDKVGLSCTEKEYQEYFDNISQEEISSFMEAKKVPSEEITRHNFTIKYFKSL